MKFERTLGSDRSKLNLISKKFECSDYEVVESLKKNDKRLFNSSNNSEKNDIMLSPIFYPNCVLQNRQIVKCQLSPSSSQNKMAPLVARLSSHGSLNISTYSHDNETNETSLEDVTELCEVRKISFSLGTFLKFSKLKEIVNDLTFDNFDWCPEIINCKRLIASVTKTNEIIIYSINNNGEVLVQQSEKFEKVSELKWVFFKKQHFLFLGSTSGDLTRFSIKVTAEGDVTAFLKIDDLKAKLRIPVFNIQADCCKESIVIICAKAHSLEIHLITESTIMSITQHVGLNITGLVRISNSKLEYLITTLYNKVHLIELSIEGNNLKIVRFVDVDNSINSDIQTSKYACYGITASKNKVLVFLAMYPKTVSSIFSSP